VKATPQQPAIFSSQTLFAELYRNNIHALLSIFFFLIKQKPHVNIKTHPAMLQHMKAK
jgi:hypothetical protein